VGGKGVLVKGVTIHHRERLTFARYSLSIHRDHDGFGPDDAAWRRLLLLVVVVGVVDVGGHVLGHASSIVLPVTARVVAHLRYNNMNRT
jgi:hypothetical protein